LFATAVVTAVPFIWMVFTSVKSFAQTIAFPMVWVPWPPDWSNFSFVFSYMPFGNMLFNSAIIAVTQTLAVLLTASMAAYAFARIKFFGRDVLFLIYLGSTAVPIWVTLIPLYLIMRDLHWINTYEGLIVPGATSVIGTFLLRQFFLSLPSEIEDAAFVDGASRWILYWNVVLPMSIPALSALGILTFMGSWNNLLWPLIMVQSPNLQTVPLGLAQLAITHGWVNILWGPMMAATTMGVVPLLVIFIVLQDRIVRGITLTGFK
jgi:multiple sugar transport system permease protein